MARAAHYEESVSLSYNPTKIAYEVLHWGFVALPAIAGADKFTRLLVNWDTYLAPAVSNMLPIAGRTFMMAVGIVELLAALLVALKPKIGAHVVAAWLGGIIVNLLLGAHYYDVALRDFGLLLGAVGLGQLAIAKDRGLIAA